MLGRPFRGTGGSEGSFGFRVSSFGFRVQALVIERSRDVKFIKLASRGWFVKNERWAAPLGGQGVARGVSCFGFKILSFNLLSVESGG